MTQVAEQVRERIRHKILVVEDESDIRELLRYNLEQDGFAVEEAADGAEALDRVRRRAPDLMVLDLMLPHMSGLEICRRIRNEPETAKLPIIVVTARSSEVDRVLGLEMGADDYVVKPFSPREVVARVKALLRRAQGRVADAGLTLHGFRLDDDTLRATWREQALPLTPVEYRLLRALVAQPERVFP